ncbi:MAG: putative deacylase, partial [Sediminicola sp.]
FEMIDRIDPLLKKQERSKHLMSKKWLRAPTAGMFIPKVTNGSEINKGQVLGIVADTFATYNKEIKAPYDGFVFCINHQAVVNQGDALFHVGK